MNRMVQNYLKQIQAAMPRLEHAVAEQTKNLKKEREKREELLQSNWSKQKEITALGQERKDYEPLKAENERLKNTQGELKKHLGSLLEITKALGEGMRQ